MRWTFAFLVAVFVAAAAYAFFGTVTVTTRGLAVARDAGPGGASAAAFFPERDRASLVPGLELRLLDPGDRSRSLHARVVSVEPQPVALATGIASLRVPAWPTSPPPSRLALVEAAIAVDHGATVTAGEVFEAEAPIGEERLLHLLLPAGRSSRED